MWIINKIRNFFSGNKKSGEVYYMLPKSKLEEMKKALDKDSPALDSDDPAVISIHYARSVLDSIRRIKEEEFKNFNPFPRTMKNLSAHEYDPNTKEMKTVALDSCDNFSFMDEQYRPSYTYAIVSKFNQTFIGWQNCAILKQDPFIDKACSIPAQDAMANGYRLVYTDARKKGSKAEDFDSDKLESILRRSVKDFRIQEICTRANINKKVFGYSLVVPTYNENIDMGEEFTPEAVKGKTYTGLTVIEPFWLTYDLDTESLTDASSKYFYEPTYYVVSGGMKKIHRSWCVKLINSPVPDVLKPTYYFGGIPLTQQLFEAVYAYQKSLNELMLLLMTKRTLIMDAEIANFMMNPQAVIDKLVAFSELRDNFAVAIKENGYDIKQIETTLTGLEEIVNALIHRMCAIAGIPVTKFLKTPLKGFNSTGEYEEKDYKQSLKLIQNDDYTPIIDLHNKLYTISEYGEEIDLTVIFNPIDNPTEMEKAKIRLDDSLTMTHRLASQLTSREEERQRLATDPNGGFGFLKPDEVPEIDDVSDIFMMEKNNKGIPEPREKTDAIRTMPKEEE